MINSVTSTDNFIRRAKRLISKFPTLKNALFDLEDSLAANPKQGVSLGSNAYKIRLADKSKGGGKSGGFRVITYLIEQTKNGTQIFLLTIYDKSEESTMSKVLVKRWIAEILRGRDK